MPSLLQLSYHVQKIALKKFVLCVTQGYFLLHFSVSETEKETPQFKTNKKNYDIPLFIFHFLLFYMFTKLICIFFTC